MKASIIKIDSSTVLRLAQRTIGIGAPFFAALQLGGLNVSIMLLAVLSSGIMHSDRTDLTSVHGWKQLLSQRIWTLAFSCLVCLAASHYTSTSSLSSTTGILTLLVVALLCSPPYRVEAAIGDSMMSPPPSSKSTSAVPSNLWDATETSLALPVRYISSPLVASTEETSLTLIAGGFAGLAAGSLYLLLDSPSISATTVVVLLLICLFNVASLGSVEIAIFGGTPIPLAAGLASAIICTTLIFFDFQALWQNSILALMAFMAVQLDLTRSKTADHDLLHPARSEKHAQHMDRNISAPTKVLLQSTERFSLLHGILADKDSRRIFYFMLLNLSFMLVQSTYGVLTGSLGLISDSIHMFFDCFALLVGLCAAVMSKWPPSLKYPYGYGKLDTLAGFGNGIFLMLISIEIVWEAIERLVEGSDVSRTMELLVVSSIGLGVNMVGILAFEHGHAHGHGGHEHSHAGHSHSHHGHSHSHSNHLTSSSTSATKPGHGHNHYGGDNMYGIYLHILADALGSVAVVVSTLCVRYFGWSGFDPLASCAIAILIFASAVPLVFGSGKKLLLSLPGDVEYTLRDILAGVSTIRGVVGYTAPKFWLDDLGKTDDEHDHHKYSQEHSHDNRHNLDHHEHSHSQHHHHDSDHSHHDECETQTQMILGVMHVIAAQHADLGDVRSRVLDYLRSKNMDVLVQVEREGDLKCWCGGGQRTG
jgi:solute carrier family 30 (zinc transporter), member 5/7